ncbi:hypothetical protein [Mycobacteroides abscessus]|uniref:hypothetical protein n=1 Tax=Mycobacteroides abscessus TaxID=36809 RepID=UPI0028BDF78A|nr:hypothetical protein [Mycobacteroides abscessus]
MSRVAGVELASGFEGDGRTRHQRQVGQKKLHALAPMTPVVGVFVDVDDDEPGDRELGNGSDVLSAAFGAAAMPVQFGLTDTKAFENFSHFSDIFVIA